VPGRSGLLSSSSKLAVVEDVENVMVVHLDDVANLAGRGAEPGHHCPREAVTNNLVHLVADLES